jgi:ABC-type branched-subunit amino acid transport system ATPase component
MFSASELVAGYGKLLAVRGVSVQCEACEVVAIVGPNGAGKSTFLKAVSGLIKPIGGSVRVGDRDLTNASPRQKVRAGLWYVPEGRGVFASLTVEQNLRLGVYAKNLSAAARLPAVYEIFPDLFSKRHQRAGELSGGQQQMVALGRGIMADPQVLLLDEPSQGLSPLLTSQVGEHVQRIARSFKVAVVLVEQSAALALDVGDRILVMVAGQVVFETKPGDVDGPRQLEEAYFGLVAP